MLERKRKEAVTEERDLERGADRPAMPWSARAMLRSNSLQELELVKGDGW